STPNRARRFRTSRPTTSPRNFPPTPSTTRSDSNTKKPLRGFSVSSYRGDDARDELAEDDERQQREGPVAFLQIGQRGHDDAGHWRCDQEEHADRQESCRRRAAAGEGCDAEPRDERDRAERDAHTEHAPEGRFEVVHRMLRTNIRTATVSRTTTSNTLSHFAGTRSVSRSPSQDPSWTPRIAGAAASTGRSPRP